MKFEDHVKVSCDWLADVIRDNNDDYGVRFDIRERGLWLFVLCRAIWDLFGRDKTISTQAKRWFRDRRLWIGSYPYILEAISDKPDTLKQKIDALIERGDNRAFFLMERRFRRAGRTPPKRRSKKRSCVPELGAA